MAKPPDPRTQLSQDDIAAIRAKLPHLTEPVKITPALRKALRLKRRIEAARRKP